MTLARNLYYYREMKRLLLTYILAVLALGVGAQNMTSSPYSRFAYGDLGDYAPNTYRGMGGVGIGMRTNKAINPMQPASYTGCDSLSFMFDLAGSVLWTHFTDASGKRNRFNGNLEYISLQVPIWRRYIAASAGVMPYSSVGYSFALADSIGSDYHYNSAYAGEGGITEVYGGLSFNIMDWFAVGANVYYMFGEVSNYVALTFDEADMTSVMHYRLLRVNSVRTRVGAQFFHNFENHAFTVGAIWEPKLPLKGNYAVIETTWLDTIQQGGAEMQVPMQWGVGASYTWQQRLTVAFDYTYQDWSNVKLFNTDYLRSRSIYAIGAEYRHNPMGRNYVDRMFWRLGAKLTDPYQRSVQGKELKLSMGIGFPLRNAATVFNATVEYGHRGVVLKENYVKLTINAAINENWFFKRKL